MWCQWITNHAYKAQQLIHAPMSGNRKPRRQQKTQAAKVEVIVEQPRTRKTRRPRKQQQRPPPLPLRPATRSPHYIKPSTKLGKPNRQLVQAIGEQYAPHVYGPCKTPTGFYNTNTMPYLDRTIIDLPGNDGYLTWHRFTTNPYYPAVAYAASDTNLALSIPFQAYISTGTAFPATNTFTRAKLNAFTVHIQAMGTNVNDVGMIVVGTMPEVDQLDPPTSFDSSCSIDQLRALPGATTINLSELMTSPISVTFSKTTPRSDNFIDTSTFAIFGARKAENIVRNLPLRKSSPTPHDRTKTKATDVGTIDNFQLVQDTMVPFVAFFNRVGTNPTSHLYLTCTRTWEGVQDISVINDNLFSPGVVTSAMPLPAKSKQHTRSEAIHRTVHKLMSDLPVFPSSETATGIDSVVEHLAHIAEKGVDWAKSPTGRSAIKTGLELAGATAFEMLPYFI